MIFSLSYVQAALAILSCMTKKRHEVVLCARSSAIICTFHALLFDNLLWYSHKVSSYQCSLNWDDSLSCRLWDVWCTSSIHVCMSRFCQDARNIFAVWPYTHARIWRDVIDACLVVWLLYASVRTRNFVNWSISRFRLLFAQRYDEMLCFAHACLVI